jgi:hypothetical protein
MEGIDMATANTQQGWALYLAAMGWHVFPLVAGSKRPAVKDWEHRATTDTDRIARCWATGDFNIGLATGPSGLVVIDLDTADDDTDDGAVVLDRLAADRGVTVPSTYAATTPSGGRHLYYASPEGVRLRNTARTIGPNIDTRAGGGYVVAPGSVLPNGGYELADDSDPAVLPAWLVQACLDRLSPTISAASQITASNPDAYAASALRGECERVRNAASGQHNAILASAAYTLGRKVGAGIVAHADARAGLTAAGEDLRISTRCGCTTREIHRVVDAGLTAGARNPVTTRTTTRQEAA